MKISNRTYQQSAIISFSNTKGKFGGLSNMAPGFSLFVNEINIPNSEALYQACRFPLFPDIQEEIISQNSPMVSKNISRQYIKYTRQDWEEIKFEVMRWCLQVKLIQNWNRFSELLQSTNNKPIVEYSKKDKVWAASPTTKGTLVGKNALGRLLMELRNDYIILRKSLDFVQSLTIPAFLLFDQPIGKVYPPEYSILDFTDNDLYLSVISQ